MQTTYHIHPNVTWHDGTPLTARDFVFGWQICLDPELPVESRVAAKEIARIDTPDDATLVIEWARTYVSANALINDDIGPLPAHLLQGTYETNKEQFWRSPYWTREFVGVGPFKLANWEPGSYLVMLANDAFYAGRPKLDVVTIRFIPSVDTIVAYVLAGEVDWAGSGFVKLSDKLQIQRELEQRGLKPTAILQTSSWRHVWIQHREPLFKELLDPRVRRALLQALDRTSLAEGISEGLSAVSDTFIPPDDFRWEWVKDSIARYPYDPKRAEQLLAEAGFRRGTDGVFVTPSDARFVLPQWATAGTQNEREVAIVADQWRTFGTPTEQFILSRAQSEDRRFRSNFPAYYHASLPSLNVENLEARFHSTRCVSEANNWTGQNYGCYVNPTADQITERWKAALDPADQRQWVTALAKLFTDDLPMLPLYFEVDLSVARPGITGIKGRAKPEGDVTWNIREWDVE
jgi:peptide/nickel transport system substrate-binding protein